MDIYDPIGIALGLEPMELSEVYNLPLQKIATNWNAIPWNKGKTYKSGPYSKDHCEAISRAKKGKPSTMINAQHPRSKPLYCITTGELFASGGDAIRKYPNMSRQNLSHHLKGRQKTIDGKVFTYNTSLAQSASNLQTASEGDPT